MSDEMVILKPIDIIYNQSDTKITAYQFIGEDDNGVKYIMSFIANAFYQPTIDKYLKKLTPVNVSKTEENKENG